MTKYIDKDALVAWIENQIDSLERNSGCSGIFGDSQMAVYDRLYSFLDTLEVKEIHEDIDLDLNPIFDEFGIDPDSRFASMFKEGFYKGVDRYLNKKENKL